MTHVTPQELDYLRAHLRQANAGDRIVCLECGAQFRNLGRHLVITHGMSVEAYRATWGDNRLTPLVCGEVLAAFRAHAQARGLGTTNTRAMALAALRCREAQGSIPLRREALERLRERRAQGQGSGPPPKITTDADLLRLTAQGLSGIEIARLRGLGKVTVWKRVSRLKARGLLIPSPPSRGGAGSSRPPRRMGAP